MKSLLASLLLISTAYAAPVELTDVTGEFKIRCTIVRIDGDTAVLKPVDGDEIKVPLNKLSADSLIRVVKELSTRLPKPPPKLEKPMIPSEAAEKLNEKTIRDFRLLTAGNGMGVHLQIKPVENIPFGKVTIDLRGQRGELTKLKMLQNLKDLSEVDTLWINLWQLNEIDTPELAAIINLFTGCKELWIKRGITGNYKERLALVPYPVAKFLGGIELPKLEILRLDIAFSDEVLVPLLKRSPDLKSLDIETPTYKDAVSSRLVRQKGLDSFGFLQFLPALEKLDLKQLKVPDDALAVVKQLPTRTAASSNTSFRLDTTLPTKNSSEIIQAGGQKGLRFSFRDSLPK